MQLGIYRFSWTRIRLVSNTDWKKVIINRMWMFNRSVWKPSSVRVRQIHVGYLSTPEPKAGHYIGMIQVIPNSVLDYASQTGKWSLTYRDPTKLLETRKSGVSWRVRLAVHLYAPSLIGSPFFRRLCMLLSPIRSANIRIHHGSTFSPHKGGYSTVRERRNLDEEWTIRHIVGWNLPRGLDER